MLVDIGQAVERCSNRSQRISLSYRWTWTTALKQFHQQYFLGLEFDDDDSREFKRVPNNYSLKKEK